MSEPTASAPLQFDTVEPAAGQTAGIAARTCTACRASMTGEYYLANAQIVCPACRDRLEAEMDRPGNIPMALLLGAGGGAVGAAIWYAVVAITDYQIGLIAILVGWLVGRGVLKGSKERGGAGYQALAMVLTYLAIAGAYAPFVVQSIPAGEGVNPVVLTVALLTTPVMVGMNSPISALIAGFGLYQAWKMNKRTRITFAGPYRVNPAPEPEAAVV
jgi:hypothetical protein